MKHLFILAGNSGGAGVLKHILMKCKKVAAFEGEGVLYTKICTLNLQGRYRKHHSVLINHYSKESTYEWDRIKSTWDMLWNKKDDNRVYMQKSPIDYARWRQLDKHFENTHFLVVFRNPYAHIQTLYERFGPRFHMTMKGCAIGYMNMMRKKQECVDNHTRCVPFRFEDLCSSDVKVRDKIVEMLPELDDIDIENVSFRHYFDNDEHPISYGLEHNENAISNISKKHMEIIKDVLYKNRKLVEKYYTI